jgi:IS30 family transposase
VLKCNHHSKQHCGRIGKYSHELATIINQRLRSTWSPEQIQSYKNQKIGISFKTIYNWIYKGKLDISSKQLRHKGKCRNPKETRGKFLIGKSISNRPKDVKKRIAVML